MTDDHPFGAGRDRSWQRPSAYTLTPEEARELAFWLLELAEAAERVEDRR